MNSDDRKIFADYVGLLNEDLEDRYKLRRVNVERHKQGLPPLTSLEADEVIKPTPKSGVLIGFAIQEHKDSDADFAIEVMPPTCVTVPGGHIDIDKFAKGAAVSIKDKYCNVVFRFVNYELAPRLKDHFDRQDIKVGSTGIVEPVQPCTWILRSAHQLAKDRKGFQYKTYEGLGGPVLVYHTALMLTKSFYTSSVGVLVALCNLSEVQALKPDKVMKQDILMPFVNRMK